MNFSIGKGKLTYSIINSININITACTPKIKCMSQQIFFLVIT